MKSITAIWLAWKYVIVLGAVLVLSLWGNYHQWKRAVSAKASAEAEQMKQLVDATNRAAAQKAKDDQKMMAKLVAIETKAVRVRTEYRTVTKRVPMPANCAPGQERIDAINKALGAQR